MQIKEIKKPIIYKNNVINSIQNIMLSQVKLKLGLIFLTASILSSSNFNAVRIINPIAAIKIFTFNIIIEISIKYNFAKALFLAPIARSIAFAAFCSMKKRQKMSFYAAYTKNSSLSCSIAWFNYIKKSKNSWCNLMQLIIDTNAQAMYNFIST